MILMNNSQSPVDLAEVDRKLEAEVEVKRLSNCQNCDSPGGSEATVDNWLFEMQLSRMISAAVRSITAGHVVFPSNSRATLCAVQKASSLCPFCMLRFLSRQRQQTIWWFHMISMCQTDCFTREKNAPFMEVHPFCRQQSESWHDTQNTHVTSLDSFFEPRGLLWLGRSQWWLPRVESERVSLHSAEPGAQCTKVSLNCSNSCQSTTKVCQAISHFGKPHLHFLMVIQLL